MIGDRKIIAVCVARIQDEATHQYITALNRAVSQDGYSLLVYNTCSTVEEHAGEVAPQFYIYDCMDYETIDVVMVFEDVMRNAKEYYYQGAFRMFKMIKENRKTIY